MFVDIHVHTMSMAELPWAPGSECPASPEQLIDMYDDAGIDKAILLPLAIPECNPITQSNEEILSIADRYPDRFVPFCNVDPRASVNSPEYDLSYIIEYYKGKGCKGIGELTANLYFDDPRVTNLFDHAEKCDLPVTLLEYRTSLKRDRRTGNTLHGETMIPQRNKGAIAVTTHIDSP